MSEEAMREARRRNQPAKLTEGDLEWLIGRVQELERQVAALWGMRVIVDESMPADEIEFRNAARNVVGRIVGLGAGREGRP